MTVKSHFIKVQFACGAALIFTLAGCSAYVETPRVGIFLPQPVVVEPPVVMQDNYVYYPSYGVYFNSYRHEYAYMDGGAWVARSEPRGVSVDVLLASPSVRMDFHDSPRNHQAEMARRYSSNWRPAGQRQNAQARPVKSQKRSQSDEKPRNDRNNP